MLRASWLAVALAVLAVARADAAVTIGSDLTRTPDSSDECASQPTCTFLQTALPGNAGALVAPTGGVMVRWRVKTAAGPAGSLRLRVLRPDGAGRYLATSSSETRTAATTAGVQTFDTRAPILAGDSLGLDLDKTPVLLALAAPGAEGSDWEPRLAASARVATFDDDDVELLFNADIEPDADADGYGDETQDGCPTEASAHGGCPVDLALTNTVAPERVDTGVDAVETVEIRNLSRYAAQGVELNWQVPPYTITVLSGPCRPPISVCALGTIPAGGTVTLQVAVRLVVSFAGSPEQQAITAASVLSRTNPDPDSTNNRAEARWTINERPFTLPPQPTLLPLPVDRSGPLITFKLPRQSSAKVLRVGVRCNEPCAGSLRATLAGRTVGQTTWRGSSAQLRIKLNARVGRELARRGRAKLVLTATAFDTSGNAKSTRKTFTLTRR